MKTVRVKVLEQTIQEILAPRLSEIGFAYEKASRTFRRGSGLITQIINVQLGQRSLEGSFALNLAIYHPEFCASDATVAERSKPRDYNCLLRERLSTLRQTPMASFFKRLIPAPDSWLGSLLTTPTDKWWAFSDDSAHVARETRDVLALLLGPGLAWLDSNSSVEVLRAAHAQRLARVAAYQARGSRSS